MPSFSPLGFGLGLRPAHYDEILSTQPEIDWFEVLTEDYLVEGGESLNYLRQIAEHYPIAMHGLSMSIGSSDPLNWDYLKQLKGLANDFQSAWISDHLCWSGVDGVYLHDLLPVPYTDEMLMYITNRVSEVQEFLGQPIVLENPSSYVTFKEDEMPEWMFISKLSYLTGCKILLDINNVYVSAYNHGFDPYVYLDNIPAK